MKFSEFIKEEELVYALDQHLHTFGSLLDYSPTLKSVIKNAAIEYKWSGEHFKALKELKPDVKALNDELQLNVLVADWNNALQRTKPVSVLIQLVNTKKNDLTFTVNDDSGNYCACAIYLAGIRYFGETGNDIKQLKEPSAYKAKETIECYLHITDREESGRAGEDVYAWVLYK
jgi:hypothetical protein